MIAAAALLFGVTVPPAIVSDGYGPYADPTAPSTGENSALAGSTDSTVPDPGAAGLWGWTHPALSAVADGESTPIGLGTNQGDDGEPVTPPPVIPATNADSKPVESSTCSFVGSNMGILFTPLDENEDIVFVGRDVPLEYVAEALDVPGVLPGTDVQITSMQPQQDDGVISLPPGTNREDLDQNGLPGVNAAVGLYRWSVRVPDTRNVIAHGTHEVTYVAGVGDPVEPVDPVDEPETPIVPVGVVNAIRESGCPTGTVRLTRGDDYTGERSRAFLFSTSDADPEGFATFTWFDPYCNEPIGSVTTNTFAMIDPGVFAAVFELQSFAADNRLGSYPYHVKLELENHDSQTIASGILEIEAG